MADFVVTYPFTDTNEYIKSNTVVENGVGSLELQDDPNNSFVEDFADDTDFTYDSAKAEFSGGKVQQKITNIIESFLQAFTSDTGFTYDSDKAEFALGLLRQKNQRPTNATFGATYTSDINGSWGDGTLTGTAIGGATVSGGKLDLTGGTIKGVSYPAVLNADHYQKGCIRFKLIPNWTGVSIGTQSFFNIGAAGDLNGISIRTVSGTNDLLLRVTNYLGNYIINATFGGFSAVDGQTYNFQLNYDFTLGQTRLYIDGINIGGLHAGTGTRSGTLDKFYIGTDFGETQLSRFKIDDFEVFSDTQTVESSYTIPEKDYLESAIQCPAMAYLYNIVSFGTPTITEVNAPKYIINDYAYFSGSWQASSDTYATAMSYADWVANIATFPGAQFGSSVIVKVVFQDSNTLGSIDSISFDINETHYVESSVTLPEMEYTGVGTMISFDEFNTTESGTPRYIVQIDQSGDYLYWNGSAWVVSDETYAQANSAATFEANLASLDIEGATIGQFKILFTDSNTQSYVDNLEAVLTTQQYPLSGTLVTTEIEAEDFTSFTSTEVNTANTTIKYAIYVNGVLKYWSGSAWVASNGLAAQCNTLADINTNIVSIVSVSSTIKFYMLLSTTDQQETPTIDNLIVNYNFGAVVGAPETCEVYGYYLDASGQPVENVTVSFTLVRNSGQYKEATSNIIAKSVSTTTDSTGYFDITLIRSSEFEGAGTYYVSFSGTGVSTSKDANGNKLQITVPDQISANLTDLLEGE